MSEEDHWDLSRHEVIEKYREIHKELIHATRKWNRAYHEFHLENRKKLESLPKTILERELHQHIKELEKVLNQLARIS